MASRIDGISSKLAFRDMVRCPPVGCNPRGEEDALDESLVRADAEGDRFTGCVRDAEHLECEHEVLLPVGMPEDAFAEVHDDVVVSELAQ